MIRAARKAARQALAWAGRVGAGPAALALFRRPERECAGVEAHTLASRRTFDAALLAFASLEFHSGRRWKFVLHDDGSLGGEHRERLAGVFEDARWVSRDEADRRAAAALADFPRCLRHRGTYNLALKFFDAPLFAGAGRLLLLDSDVIFFGMPRELVAWVDGGDSRCLYNEDTREKFCLPRAVIESRFAGPPAPPRFNSGLVLYPGPPPSWKRAEEFLEAFEEEAHAPQFIEQTLWALAAACAPGGAAPLPRIYNVSWGYLREGGSVARHYLGEFKHDLLYIEGAPHLLYSLLARRGLSGKHSA